MLGNFHFISFISLKRQMAVCFLSVLQELGGTLKRSGQSLLNLMWYYYTFMNYVDLYSGHVW